MGAVRFLLSVGAAWASPWAAFPPPPAQTPHQRALFAVKAAEAKEASDAATPAVLDFLASEELHEALERCCPRAAAMSAQALLESLRRELRASELAHTFSAVPSGLFVDVTLQALSNMTWFPNEWQAALLAGGVPMEQGQIVSDRAQVEIFGCSAFATGNATWAEASDRLIYAASNMRRLDTAAYPVYGDVSAIFSSEYLQHMVLIAPVDTGLLILGCETNATLPPRLPSTNCEAWSPRTLGTLEHFDHLLLPHFNMLRNQSMAQEAAALIARSALGGDYADIPRIDLMSQLRYFESNILGNPALPTAVRFLIGRFDSLFGTDAGRQLQTVALQRSWPLVWALGSAGLNMSSLLLPEAGNERLLDGVVARELTNASVGAAAASNFETVWEEMSAARTDRPLAPLRIRAFWSKLKEAQPRLAPLSAGACADMERCIGTLLSSGDCVCSKLPEPVVVV